MPEFRDRLADLLPPWGRSAVVAPSWRAVLALGLVGLMAVLLTAGAMWRARPHTSAVGSVPTVSVSPPTGRPATAGSAPPPSAAARPVLVVAVAGKVRHPGLVRLAAGARVQDAVRAAGGVRPGASLGLLNLARPVVDGEQILVGVGGAAAGPAAPAPGPGGGTAGSGGTGAGATGTGGAPVDINTATESDLEQLPGVGPVLAQRILDWRTAHGSFSSVDQLRQVSGIGDKKFADLRPQVRV